MTDIMTYLNNGLAVVLVVLACIGISKVVKWSAANVVVPLKDAAITHLQETTTAVKGLSESIPAMHADIKEIKQNLPEPCKFLPK